MCCACGGGSTTGSGYNDYSYGYGTGPGGSGSGSGSDYVGMYLSLFTPNGETEVDLDGFIAGLSALIQSGNGESGELLHKLDFSTRVGLQFGCKITEFTSTSTFEVFSPPHVREHNQLPSLLPPLPSSTVNCSQVHRRLRV